MATIKVKINDEWVEMPSIGILPMPEAPIDGKLYGRKDGNWSEINVDTKYLDLSMFTGETGTLSEEDYQKVVKAYEDKINIGYISSGESTTIIPIAIEFNNVSYIISCLSSINYEKAYYILSKNYGVSIEDKNYISTTMHSLIDQSGTGTKALTDDGNYKEFASPVKTEDGGSGSVSKELKPNVYYQFGECTNLTITLGAEIPNIYNEYMFEFTSGTNPTVLGLPSTVKWNGGNTPTIEASKSYIVAIVNNIAVIGGA